MSTPCIIKYAFWLLVIISIICGLGSIAHSFGTDINLGTGYYHVQGSAWLFAYGVLQIVLGIVFSKVICELILVLFKINANLEAIKNKRTLLDD